MKFEDTKIDISTITVSKKLKMNHSSVLKMALKYSRILNEFGNAIKYKKIQSNLGLGGRPLGIIFLNKKQEKVLILLIRNTEESIKEKVKILKSLL